MILKDYQKRTLTTVTHFLRSLTQAKEDDRQARIRDPEWRLNWAERAWEKILPMKKYNNRLNGLGECLPSFCLKIPTGGGKTLIATRVIDLVNAHFRYSRRGLVLWIVPTSQIYRQTLKALKDRDHPYRQQLDLSSGQRTRIFEKTSSFNPQDVVENLCILLLMLPSANRGLTQRDKLRIYRDSGAFDQFFPDSDDLSAHEKLLKHFPNLDTFEGYAGFGGRLIKTSLGNTIRLLKPLIILDEGHKAYSANAKRTLEGFNPCMVVELSATPDKLSNVLVEIQGVELNAEEMVKLDLHIRNKEGRNWRDTLLESIQHREVLESEARRYEAESGIYIRPVCVIQVERTGRGQRKPEYIHTEDVREYLLWCDGIQLEHIAVKTSEKDELKEMDEIGGLMSRNCPIRFIITKQALQEGWDCSFAYILTILTNPMSRTSLTQLVGRILRQPYAHKTGNPWLDESYVFCFNRRAKDILHEVRKGFGLEGLQDLEARIVADEDRVKPTKRLKTRQGSHYCTEIRNRVLPAFMIQDRVGWRLAQYETDILSRLPWQEIDISTLSTLNFSERTSGNVMLRTNLDEPVRIENVVDSEDGHVIDYGTATSHILDLVPNPWHGYHFVQRTFEALLEYHPFEYVAANYVFVLEQLRDVLEQECDRLSRMVFDSLIESDTIRFLVVAEELEFNCLPDEISIPKVKRMGMEASTPNQLSPFNAIPGDDLNKSENKVATYLDQQARMFFWYSNQHRKGYFTQGWRPRRIYKDFTATLKDEELVSKDESHEVFLVETKGLYLDRSEDPNSKRSVFDICNEHTQKADWGKFALAMCGGGVRFEIVDKEKWDVRLNEVLFSDDPKLETKSE